MSGQPSTKELTSVILTTATVGKLPEMAPLKQAIKNADYLTRELVEIFQVDEVINDKFTGVEDVKKI